MLSIPINDISGVAANSTTTLRITRGWTYHELEITYGGMKLSDIGEIRVLLNGQPVQRFRDAGELVRMNQYDGIDLEHNLAYQNPAKDAAEIATLKDALPTSGSFSIVFDRPNMRTRLGEQMTAIGTGRPLSDDNPFPVNNFVVEVDVNSATNPTMEVSAQVTDPSPTGWIIKKRTFERDPTGEGEFQIGDIPKFGRINRVFFHADKVNVLSKVKIERDTYKVYERKLAEATKKEMRFLKEWGGVHFSWMTVINPTERGFADEGLEVLYPDGNQVSDFRFILDVADACHLSITVEYFAQLGTN